ncbi:hypothetical protein HMPREF3213_00408 [Heyndrickxia coagulans]|uniref:Uncharacterized protein n=1 Tax=Heyndrickxia coagulans TaxID=1398 RepID=A0A133L173_HEYCO|nr:hypothetical protein HMPREF3213_00408 [Heyndrickxia coagulans]
MEGRISLNFISIYILVFMCFYGKLNTNKKKDTNRILFWRKLP